MHREQCAQSPQIGLALAQVALAQVALAQTVLASLVVQPRPNSWSKSQSQSACVLLGKRQSYKDCRVHVHAILYSLFFLIYYDCALTKADTKQHECTHKHAHTQTDIHRHRYRQTHTHIKTHKANIRGENLSSISHS